ncbi:MAG: phosphoribosyl-ATP diphosphatase [Pirellulaceae bacterium]|jgi:phosphoribosyl-ATP pyrophosphohydrolase|nr:phosphoribosyl-ATP diphosphatase [Pirellulaceae bacterium]
MSRTPFTVAQLQEVIRQRQAQPHARSYTATLLAGGAEKIGGKIQEEAAEVVAAADEAGAAGREHLVREVADLVYHVLVLLRWADLDWQDVEAELARRMGISGLDEKAARGAALPRPTDSAEGDAR